MRALQFTDAISILYSIAYRSVRRGITEDKQHSAALGVDREYHWSSRIPRRRESMDKERK